MKTRGVDKRKPSNALVESTGEWTYLRPTCHPEAQFQIRHSTTHGIYDIECATCGRCKLRIEVGRGR